MKTWNVSAESAPSKSGASGGKFIKENPVTPFKGKSKSHDSAPKVGFSKNVK